LRQAGAGQAGVHDEQAGRIAELCGFNALELSLVGGLLGGGSCTPDVRPFWVLGCKCIKAPPKLLGGTDTRTLTILYLSHPRTSLRQAQL
jgi:hypothetical protein